MSSVEAAICHCVAAIVSQFAHDLVATDRDRNDLITPAVRDEDTWFPHPLIRQRPSAREGDDAAEEVTICEPEPQRHACPGREAADCNAPGIDAAACESLLQRTVDEIDVGVSERPRRSGCCWPRNW